MVRALTTSSLGLGYLYIFLAVFGVIALLGGALITSVSHKTASKGTSAISNFGKFFYASFLKPHNRHGTQGGQQAALESFYNAQVSSFKRFCESVSNMIAHGMLQERFRSSISVWRPEKRQIKRWDTARKLTYRFHRPIWNIFATCNTCWNLRRWSMTSGAN